MRVVELNIRREELVHGEALSASLKRNFRCDNVSLSELDLSGNIYQVTFITYRPVKSVTRTMSLQELIEYYCEEMVLREHWSEIGMSEGFANI